MAKDPAFLFYPGDFTTGTQFFTDEQIGKYMRLLMAQHQLGHLEEKHMLQICKTHDKDVFSKFIKDEEGKYYNERLDKEIVKRRNYSKSRSENRQKKEEKEETYVNHMENRNENRNTNGINNKKGIRFDENFEFVFFYDGSKQQLGGEQKILAETGGITPSTIIKGSIY